MLIDSAIIRIRSGRGGDGHVSFARYKYVPKGGPSGGDGGNGGSVTLLADSGVDTLLDFAGRHDWAAENGEPGGIKECHGRQGEDLTLKVPLGTLVYDEADGKLLIDLDVAGKSLLVAQGGRGGFGNQHFATPTHQAPREFTPGEAAQERVLRLELKLIADVGLVGKPNAGKSTLLSVVSKARPKIADYPFTTLEPNLGIAELPTRKGGQSARRLVIADIPGLIEGAHEGHGLGIQFLRHIERTRLLVHLVEVEPSDGSDPVENYKVICKELRAYSRKLGRKPQIIALTKMDLLATEEDRQTAEDMIAKEIGKPVVRISAVSREGLAELLEMCWKTLKK